ncbi:MAG: hypothetical protein PF501_02520 [Salinisphaera sp.]|nr:hypothetical protein [Salinisphaera sp.]
MTVIALWIVTYPKAEFQLDAATAWAFLRQKRFGSLIVCDPFDDGYARRPCHGSGGPVLAELRRLEANQRPKPTCIDGFEE